MDRSPEFIPGLKVKPNKGEAVIGGGAPAPAGDSESNARGRWLSRVLNKIRGGETGQVVNRRTGEVTNVKKGKELERNQTLGQALDARLAKYNVGLEEFTKRGGTVFQVKGLPDPINKALLEFSVQAFLLADSPAAVARGLSGRFGSRSKTQGKHK